MRSAFAGLCVALLLASGAGPVVADEAPWLANTDDGDLEFSAWYEGDELRGSFAHFNVRAQLDPAGDGPQALTVEVRVGSADMRDREVNEELREPDWFDAASFPLAVFQCDEVRPAESGYLAAGTLHLKGIDRPLVLPLELQRDGDTATLSGSVILSRRDWQIGTGEWADDERLEDRVEVRYRVALQPGR